MIHSSTSCNICCSTNVEQCCTNVLNGIELVSIFVQHRCSTTFNVLNIQHDATHCSTFVEQQLQHLLINNVESCITGFRVVCLRNNIISSAQSSFFQRRTKFGRVQFVIFGKKFKCLFIPNCTRKITSLLIKNRHEQFSS